MTSAAQNNRCSAQYEFNFDALFQTPETKALFAKHCQKEYNRENVDFLDAIRSYLQVPDSQLHKEAQAIFDNFCEESAKYELNITAQLREQVRTRLLQLAPSSSNDDKTSIDANIITQLRQVFDPVYDHVLLYLKYDCFARFLRTPEWLNFVAGANLKLLDAVGVHKSKIKYLQLDEQDFSRPYITDKDVAIAQLLLKDYYFWRLLKNGKKKRYQIFATETHFISNEAMKKLGLLTSAKLFCELPGKAIDCMRINCDAAFASHWNFTYEHLKYVPANTHPDSKYASTMIRTYSKDLGLISGREYIFVESVLYDANQRMYMRVGRSVLDDTIPVHKGKVRGIGFKVDCWIHVNDYSCLHTSIMLCNPKGQIEPRSVELNFIGRTIVCNVAKQLCLGAHSALKSCTKQQKTVYSFGDACKLYQTLLDNKPL